MSRRPLPAAVYWRRRMLLLAAVLLVAWIGVRLWPSGGDDPRPAATPTAPRTTATPSGEKDGETTVSLTSSTTRCDPQDVRIVPSVRSGQRAGAPVQVDLAVSTTTTKPCTLTLTAKDVLAVVESGKTAVWDSSVCRSPVLADPVALSPGWSTVATTRWSGRGSGPGCSPKEGYASPGRYTLRVGTIGGEPGETTFRLGQRAPKPKPTKSSPSPKPSASGSSRPTPTPSASGR
ncbi:MAG: hypothetical protein PGN07_00900 [Aeromicrobium erythreum]